MSGAPLSGAAVAWHTVLVETVARLAGVGVASPAAEARLLIEEAAGVSGVSLLLAHDEPASIRQLEHLEAMLARRLTGEPLQYVFGHWAFRTLDLLVDSRVLIPRPETEVVAEYALVELDRRLVERLTAGSCRRATQADDASSLRDPVEQPVVVDLGTGSGALALSVAVERPGVSVWGVERSADALAVARANLRALGRAGRDVQLLEGRWFEPLPAALQGRVDVIVSNPPYVAETDPLPPEVGEREPREALVAGPTGLEAIEVIISDSCRLLGGGCALVVEIGASQGDAAGALARAAGFVEVTVHPDLAGRDRVLVARTPAEPAP